MNKENVKTIKIECSSCKGTGVYKGFAEKGACGIVCYICNGTGETTFSYKEFTGLKKRDDIKRVFSSSCGYAHSDKNTDIISKTTGKVEKTLHFENYGCTYEEWLNGATPKPMEELYCPYVFDNRGIGNEPCSRCKEGNPGFGLISNCAHYGDKAKCWQEYWAKKEVQADAGLPDDYVVTA